MFGKRFHKMFYFLALFENSYFAKKNLKTIDSFIFKCIFSRMSSTGSHIIKKSHVYLIASEMFYKSMKFRKILYFGNVI